MNFHTLEWKAGVDAEFVSDSGATGNDFFITGPFNMRLSYASEKDDFFLT